MAAPTPLRNVLALAAAACLALALPGCAGPTPDPTPSPRAAPGAYRNSLGMQMLRAPRVNDR